MLRIVATRWDGGRQPLHALAVALDGDTKVPADSLTVTCPFDEVLRQDTAKIEAFDGERQVFVGKPDQIVTEKRAQGAILRFTARSPAAFLLDSEAEPITYFQPTVGLMEGRHLAPFGIRVMTKDNVPSYHALKIDKGMSHWQVLQSFCRNRFACEPRITGDGRAYLKGEPEEGEVLFSDTGGVRYFALTEYQKPHRLLSQIRLKFEQANAYRAVIENTSPAARGDRKHFSGGTGRSLRALCQCRFGQNDARHRRKNARKQQPQQLCPAAAVPWLSVVGARQARSGAGQRARHR